MGMQVGLSSHFHSVPYVILVTILVVVLILILHHILILIPILVPIPIPIRVKFFSSSEKRDHIKYFEKYKQCFIKTVRKVPARPHEGPRTTVQSGPHQKKRHPSKKTNLFFLRGGPCFF